MKVITHAGSAHADEFIALAVIVHLTGVARIDRRDPTADELDNPSAWVVDVGGRYEPHLLNFDHHGVPGTEGRCAFDLVLEKFGLADVAKAASPWLAFKSSLDCVGPVATAKAFGMPSEALYATLSPIESQILNEFSSQSVILLGDFIFECLRVIGNGLCRYWLEFKQQLELVDKADIIDVDGLLFCDYRDCGKLLPAVMFKHMTAIGAAGSITVDDRDPGCEDRVVLYRHNDHPRVDFRKIDASAMHFVHHNGFLAKTKTGDNSLARIIELLQVAAKS